MTAGQKKLLFWGALLVLGAYFFGQCQPQSDDAELNKLVAGTLAAGKAHRRALAVRDTASARVDRQLARLRVQASRNAARADSAHSVGDSLLRALGQAVSAQDSLVAALALTGTLAGEVSALRAARVSDSLAFDSLRVDRDAWKAIAQEGGRVSAGADSTLAVVNEARKCRVVFLPCPSRVTSAVLGLVGGVVLGAVVR